MPSNILEAVYNDAHMVEHIAYVVRNVSAFGVEWS